MDSNRVKLLVLALSAAGLVGIAVDEGYSAKPYFDSNKTLTIGFGSTEGVKLGDTTTPVKALQRKLLDIGRYSQTLKRCVTVPLYQYEFDAYVNLAYNIGPTAFCNSTLVTRLNKLDYAGACDAILMWRMVGDTDCSAPRNKTCAGIWARRLRTHRQCLGQEQVQS